MYLLFGEGFEQKMIVINKTCTHARWKGVCIPVFLRIMESNNFLPALSIVLHFFLVAFKKDLLFVAIRVSILLCITALGKRGMAAVQNWSNKFVTMRNVLSTVPEHRTYRKLHVLTKVSALTNIMLNSLHNDYLNINL